LAAEVAHASRQRGDPGKVEYRAGAASGECILHPLDCGAMVLHIDPVSGIAALIAAGKSETTRQVRGQAEAAPPADEGWSVMQA
jgi:hypothetical protein